MFTFQLIEEERKRAAPWNKGKLLGQRRPLKLKEIWGIRIRLQMEHRIRDLALFNLAIYSKLRGCDLVKLRVADITHGGQLMSRASVIRRKAQQPVQFEITEETRESVFAWIIGVRLTGWDHLFPSRVSSSSHISTRQYTRIARH